MKELFETAERPALRPLPAERFPSFHEKQRAVHRDAHVEVAKAYYSVPPEYVGRSVWVRWDERLVRVFNTRWEEIALHVRCEPGRFSTALAHLAAEKISSVERGADELLRRARRIGAQTGRWSETMQTCLKKLRLSGLAETLDVRLQEASGNRLSHAEFLELALKDELTVRESRLIERHTKAACFRERRTLDDFNWDFNPTIKRQRLYDLAAGDFIRKAQDILLIGPPGVGKSHLAQALGLQLVRQGFLVMYRSIFDVVRDFLNEEALEPEGRILGRYLKPDLLIIDDMGMKQLPRRSGECLFEIVMRRYEVRSTLMTANPSDSASVVQMSLKIPFSRSSEGSPDPDRSRSLVGRWSFPVQTAKSMAPLSTSAFEYLECPNRYRNRSKAYRVSRKLWSSPVFRWTFSSRV